MTSHFRQASTRERQLVIATTIILPVVLLVFGLWLPLKDKQGVLRVQVRQLESQLYEANALADMALKRGFGEHRSLVRVVDNAAQQAGIRSHIIRIRPQPGMDGQQPRLLVSIRHAPFSLLVRFLTGLASQHAYVGAFKLYPASRKGRVDADLTLAGQ